jgi:four helix bundle protein
LNEKKISSHKDLIVWQQGIRIVKEVYSLTKLFPKSEMFGLSSQLQRAAVSVPANIAEGYGRFYRGEYIRFLTIANGSVQELETLLEIAFHLGYFGQAAHDSLGRLIESESVLLNSLIRSLRRAPPSVP